MSLFRKKYKMTEKEKELQAKLVKSLEINEKLVKEIDLNKVTASDEKEAAEKTALELKKEAEDKEKKIQEDIDKRIAKVEKLIASATVKEIEPKKKVSDGRRIGGM